MNLFLVIYLALLEVLSRLDCIHGNDMNQIALNIHGAMIADKTRNNALNSAIKAIVKAGDVVIDIGTGTGLLAMLAARMGARRVYALECSAIANAAKQLVNLNHLSDVITVIHSSSFQWEANELADVILCETLGFSALDENFRLTILDARDRMLRPGGILLPSRIKIWVVPVDSSDSVVDLTTLDDILGLEFTPLADIFRKTYQRRYIPYEEELALPETVFDLDCYLIANSANLLSCTQFKITRKGLLTGFGLWFEAELAKDLHLNSRKPELDNHWAQTYMPLPSAIPVEPGMHIAFKLEMRDQWNNFFMLWEAQAL